MNRRFLLAAILFGVLLAPASGWSSDAPADSASAAVEPAEATAEDLPDGPGKTAVMKSCVGPCHGSSVFPSDYSPNDWVNRVDEMIGLGARVSDDDYATIVVYLVMHYGAEPESP